MVGWVPKSCLLSHVTGLLFCLHVKFFLHSIFKSVDIWSSLSSIVLDVELEDKEGFKKLRIFFLGLFKDTHFALQKSTNPQSKRFGVQKNLHEFVWKRRHLDNGELAENHSRAVKSQYLPKKTKNCKILGSVLHKDVENLEDHGSPIIQDVFVEEMWVCSSYPFRHKTTFQCKEHQADLFGNWLKHHL